MDKIDATPVSRPDAGASNNVTETTALGSWGRPQVLGTPDGERARAMMEAALFGDRDAPAIGRYRLLHRLGEGGAGVVYAAHDDTLGRKVAVKVLRDVRLENAEARARVLLEARALARLSHPNVVQVYEIGEHAQQVFVAMELVDGPTVREWMAARRRSWREVVGIMCQAAAGLAAAHRAGIIHRDFKPANAIVGNDGRVRVVDFGIARVDAESVRPALAAVDAPVTRWTMTGSILGTPAYMAPEQLSGAPVDASTDQFAFCVAVFEALYGERPFAGATLGALFVSLVAEPAAPVNRDVPAWLDRIIRRGLARDPADRWPSMEVLAAAMSRDPARRRNIQALSAVGIALTLTTAGLAWRSAGLSERADDEAQRATQLSDLADEQALHAEQARAQAAREHLEVTRSHDEKLLTEARAALTRDPVETIRALAQLAGDDPATWQRARFLAAAAQARGLPEHVLRAGDRSLAEVLPMAGGGFIGRDDLGAVWQWTMSEKTGVKIPLSGAATQVLAARDVPMWAAMTGASVQVFGDGLVQTIDLGAIEPISYDWRLTPDGRTLVAWLRLVQETERNSHAAYLWDLTRSGAAPRTIALPEAWTHAVIADDASVVVISAGANGLRVIGSEEGAETKLRYRGRPQWLSTDRRFVIASPFDQDGVLDVVDIETGKSRRVKADDAVVLEGSDVLFARRSTSTGLRRESLATGAIAWKALVPPQGGQLLERTLVVDPAGDRFAVALGDGWGVGDLRHGGLMSFISVPKDISPQWVEGDALMVVVGNEVRIHRPAAAPVKIRQDGQHCALAPGGGWAVVTPWDVARGEYTRVDLNTKVKTTFRCPTRPTTTDDGGVYESYWASPAIDDAGQIAMIGEHGWSCWWDEQHGARTGTQARGWLVGLPRGVALVTGADVEVWSGPDELLKRWTAAGRVVDLQASPSGAVLAVRSDRGVQLLRVDTGEVTAVQTEATPVSRRAAFLGRLAWSPDSARLAVLSKVEGPLELTLWDVALEPREIGRHDLKDSQEMLRNLVTFTPAGTTVALSDRHKSMTPVILGSEDTRRFELPELYTFHMRSETDAIGVDLRGGLIMADLAAGEVSPLRPNPETTGRSTGPRMRSSADGSVWACNVLGPATLVEIAAMDGTAPQDMRDRLHDLAAAL